MKDIFGKELSLSEARALVSSKRTQRRGYAAPPGTGPEGETCKSCRHLSRKEMGKTYLKCGLMKMAWTGGSGTDVLAKAPACRLWEAAA